MDHRVIEVDSPATALGLESAVLDSADLLLSDVQMPGMSGARLADVLEALRPGLRSILMSGYAPEAVLGDHPGRTFLPKPVDRAALAAAVAEGLKR